MKKFKISDIEVVNVYRDGGTFKPHYMYKDGNKVLAETYEQHVNLGKAGYIHKMEDGGRMPVEEALTDYSVQELPEHLEHMANAEVEKGEFLKYPNEQIAKVKGETHENGGVDTVLPVGTEVLSHNLKIDNVLRNRLNKEMNLGLKVGATQADAMTAYDRVSGYTKLNQEQEELFASLNDLDSKDKTTQAVNERYLNEKIFKVENQKKQLEGDRVKLFNRLFANQELGKKAEEEGDPFIARYGGMKKSGKLKEIASKYNISEDKAYMLLGGKMSYENGGTTKIQAKAQLDKYLQLQLIDEDTHGYLKGELESGNMTPEKVLEEVQGGIYGDIVTEYQEGTIDEEQAKERRVTKLQELDAPVTDQEASDLKDQEIPQFTYQDIDEYTEDIVNPQAGIGYQHQSQTGSGMFGRVEGEKAERVGWMKEYLPTMYRYIQDGNFSEENVTAAQRSYNRTQDAIAKYLKDTGASQSRIDRVLDQKFTERQGDERVSDIDGKFGNFTSSRGAEALPMYPEEKQKKLEALGIHNFSQLDENDERIRDILDDKDLKKAREMKAKYGEDFDFIMTPIRKQPVAGKPETQQEYPETVSYFNFTDKTIRPQERVGLVFPHQYVAPVSGLEPLMEGRVRMGRVDPVKVGIEEELRETNRAHNQLIEQLNQVPDSQRAAMLTAIGISETINKAFTAANKLNQNAIQQADLTNVRQADTENLTNMNLALQYQKEMLTAKAKQEQNVKNFLTKKDQIANQRFYQTVDLNNILANTPDVTTDIFGRATYDPSIDYSLPYRTVQGTVTPTGGVGQFSLVDDMASQTTRTGQQLPQDVLDHNQALADIMRGGGSAKLVSTGFTGGSIYEIYDKDGNLVGDYSTV